MGGFSCLFYYVLYGAETRHHSGMMYNTGDLGRLREDGKFDHHGRVDDQVKVKVSVSHSPQASTLVDWGRNGRRTGLVCQRRWMPLEPNSRIHGARGVCQPALSQRVT